MSSTTAISDKSRYPSVASRILPFYLRCFATLSFLFGAMILAVAGFGFNAPGVLIRIFRWTYHPAEFPPAAMLGAIYVVWGFFIWRSARNPMANSMFVDFTVVGNAAHGAIMIYMAISMPGMVEHLYTDTLLLELGVPILLVLWLPVRNCRPAAGSCATQQLR